MRKIELELEGVTVTARLLDKKAPKTCQALWDALPIIDDRTIHTAWSGSAWRTERNYQLLPEGEPVENVAERLQPGDVIYYANFRIPLLKVGVAYGPAQWLAPFRQPIDVALIAKINENLEQFREVCRRILFEGPKVVSIRRK